MRFEHLGCMLVESDGITEVCGASPKKVTGHKNRRPAIYRQAMRLFNADATPLHHVLALGASKNLRYSRRPYQQDINSSKRMISNRFNKAF